jgi:hypothetical protein
MATMARGVALNSAAVGQQANLQLCGVVGVADTLIPGNNYFLSTVPGHVVAQAAYTKNNTIQCVGFAISANELYFDPQIMPLLIT